MEICVLHPTMKYLAPHGLHGEWLSKNVLITPSGHANYNRETFNQFLFVLWLPLKEYVFEDGRIDCQDAAIHSKICTLRLKDDGAIFKPEM
jgi:hypothetical protein